MPNRAVLVLALAAALAFPAAARAMDAKKTGEISAEIEDKENAVKAKYGGRSWKEMSNDERKSFQKDMDKAREDTLQKHGTSGREYETTKLKMGREGLKSAEDGKKDYATKKAEEEKAKAEAAKPKAKEPEIKVQKGFNDDNPVTMDGKDPSGGEEGMGKVIDVPQDGAPAQ
ncbi:MAG TPA: hypothetical protein VGK67_01730 [Myxococcales bacterium]|jgi:hypothetical protein